MIDGCGMRLTILRVASTAAPVSGSEVRLRMVELGNEQIRKWAAEQIQVAFRLFSKLKRLARNEARRRPLNLGGSLSERLSPSFWSMDRSRYEA